MFSWAKPISNSSEGFNPEDYTFEGDGGLLAFEEAFHDIAMINEKFAEANTEGVNRFAQAWHEGGRRAAMEAANAYVNGPVMEGVIGDAWESVKKAFKKLWEKIKAFFHSAIQYFDAIFKSAKTFAEKYEDEINDKDLDGFKYEMHRWDFKKFGSIDWKKVEQEALKAGKSKGVVMEASGTINGWVDVLMEAIYYNQTTHQWAQGPDGDMPLKAGWSVDKSKDDIEHFSDKDLWREVPRNTARGEGGSSSGPSATNDAGTSSTSSTSSVEKISSSQKKEVERALISALGYGSQKNSLEAFKKALMQDLQGGTEKKNRDNPVDECLEYLKDNEDLDNIKEWESTMNNSFGEMEDALNISDKKDDEKTKAKNRLAVFTIGKNVAMDMFSVYTSAVKQRQSECKGCLSAALHYKAPKD